MKRAILRLKNASVSFNILTADVIQNGNVLQSSVSGGTPPYTYEWSDKMDEILSTDSCFSTKDTSQEIIYSMCMTKTIAFTLFM